MKKETSAETFDASQYQLPQQEWQCGHHGEGTPCAIGPNGSGECIVTQICTPFLDESGWHCTRAKAWGGRCKEGPVPDSDAPDQKAICPHQPVSCQPQRTLHNKRRLVTWITAALALGCCLIILGGSSGTTNDSIISTSAVISPGKLSSHHTPLGQDCAACHSTASASPIDVLNCAFGSSKHPTDSQKCVECHHEFGQHPFHAHSIDPARLGETTEHILADKPDQTMQHRLAQVFSGHPKTGSAELACSTCHMEHQGASFNLTELTNAQCQQCHSSSFHSFADGHPEFKERKRSFLYFDHATHLHAHFEHSSNGIGESASTLSCNDCHIPDADGSSMILASFEKTCAQCHGQQITDDHMPPGLRMAGTRFFTLDAKSPQPPFMELLLRDDRGDVALEILMSDFVARREVAVTERLEQAVSVGISPASISRVANHLEESGFFVALEWLARPQDKNGAGNDQEPNAFPSGAWSLAESEQTLVYRSRGHADPFLREWLNFAAATTTSYPDAPAADFSGAFDRLFQQLAAPEATGRCMKCHTVDALPTGKHRINWNSRQVLTSNDGFTRFDDGFTRFDHGPHITLLSSSQQATAMHSTPDTRCQTCHALQEQTPALRKKEFVTEDWMPNPNFDHTACSGLTSVSRKSCVSCHTPTQAGDSCVQCHNYHIHPDKLNER